MDKRFLATTTQFAQPAKMSSTPISPAKLTIRALLIGDRRSAVVLALETALAGLPAGIVAIYASHFRLL